jgi:hypothetical protein
MHIHDFFANLNENRPGSGMTRSTPPVRKSKPAAASSAGGSALTVIHNKPWK